MYSTFIHFTRNIGSRLRRWSDDYSGYQAVQGRAGLAEGKIPHRKLILAVVLLLPTYIGWFLGLNPDQLAGVVGVVFGAFCTADMANTYSYHRYKDVRDDLHKDWGEGG